MTKSQASTKAILVQAVYVLTYPMLKLMNPKVPEKQLNGEFHIAVQGWLNGYSRQNVDLLLSQASLEAGHGWKNKATLQDNNPFGMGKVKQRPTLQYPEPRKAEDSTGRNYIAGYSSIAMGVADRFLWDSYYNLNPKTPQYIAAVLDKGYNQNTQYSFSWENTKSQGLSIRKIHLAMISMLVLGFLGFQYFKKGLKL
jgi:hypothetical protein